MTNTLSTMTAYATNYESELYAANGYIESFKVLESKNGGNRLSNMVCAQAARGGHIEFLRYAFSKGYPLEPCVQTAFGPEKIYIVKYILMGSYDNPNRYEQLKQCLEFAIDNGCELKEEFCVTAAKQGDLPMLLLLRDYDCPFHYKTVCDVAKKGGYFELYEYLVNYCGELR
jgi:hypothetical protein